MSPLYFGSETFASGTREENPPTAKFEIYFPTVSGSRVGIYLFPKQALLQSGSLLDRLDICSRVGTVSPASAMPRKKNRSCAHSNPAGLSLPSKPANLQALIEPPRQASAISLRSKYPSDRAETGDVQLLVANEKPASKTPSPKWKRVM